MSHPAHTQLTPSTHLVHTYTSRSHDLFINETYAELELYSLTLALSQTLIGTLTLDGWSVTFGTTRTGPSGRVGTPLYPPSLLYQM